MIKKPAALLLALLLLCSAIPVSFAAEAQGAYASTQQFIATLNEQDVHYTYSGVDSSEYDVVVVNLQGDNTTVELRFFFNSDGQDCGIRVWDLITYDEIFDIAVCRAVNTLNQQYRFAAFYADTDFTVTASMDVIFHENDDIGGICYDAMMFVADVCNTAYPALVPFSN